LFHEQKQLINREEILLDVGQVSSYPQIQDLVLRKEPFERLWRNVLAFNQYYDKWMNGPLLGVNAEVVEEVVRAINNYLSTNVSIYAFLTNHNPQVRIIVNNTVRAKSSKFFFKR